MAPKKKPDTDDVEKAKGKIAEDARAVGKAAESMVKQPYGIEHYDANADWADVKGDVDSMDALFKKGLDGSIASVRVMQIGPDGKLIDVSDKISSKDLRADQSDDRMLRDTRTKEAAFKLLQRLLPGLKASDLQIDQPYSTTKESIRRMEAVLAESDKILEHWRKKS